MCIVWRKGDDGVKQRYRLRICGPGPFINIIVIIILSRERKVYQKYLFFASYRYTKRSGRYIPRGRSWRRHADNECVTVTLEVSNCDGQVAASPWCRAHFLIIRIIRLLRLMQQQVRLSCSVSIYRVPIPIPISILSHTIPSQLCQNQGLVALPKWGLARHLQPATRVLPVNVTCTFTFTWPTGNARALITNYNPFHALHQKPVTLAEIFRHVHSNINNLSFHKLLLITNHYCTLFLLNRTTCKSYILKFYYLKKGIKNYRLYKNHHHKNKVKFLWNN